MRDNKKKVALGLIARWRREVSWVKEMISIKRGEGMGYAWAKKKKIGIVRMNRKNKYFLFITFSYTKPLEIVAES